MQVVFRSLLAAGLVACIASCRLDNHGLGATTGHVTFDAGTPGAGGTGGVAAMGAAGMSGAAGTIAPTDDAGDDASGAAGASGGTDGDGGVGGDTSGAAGTDTSGVAGESGNGGVGDAVDASGAAGTDASSDGGGGAAGAPVSVIGCADGTREGFVDTDQYPTIAACEGAWDEPGLLSTESRMPECNRRSGNDGAVTDGRGCSVADVCADGWSVCETAHAVAVATAGAGCVEAYEAYGAMPAFFVTRQRAEGLVCDPTNTMGTNNIYGCGNVGSAADKSCAPFTRMMRDSDCQNQKPWACADGNIGQAQDEYTVVTKSGTSRGGVLCCKD